MDEEDFDPSNPIRPEGYPPLPRESPKPRPKAIPPRQRRRTFRGWANDLLDSFSDWIRSQWTNESIYGWGRALFAICLVSIVAVIGYCVFYSQERPAIRVIPTADEIMEEKREDSAEKDPVEKSVGP